jgi:hypothetical protein
MVMVRQHHGLSFSFLLLYRICPFFSSFCFVSLEAPDILNRAVNRFLNNALGPSSTHGYRENIFGNRLNTSFAPYASSGIIMTVTIQLTSMTADAVVPVSPDESYTLQVSHCVHKYKVTFFLRRLFETSGCRAYIDLCRSTLMELA